MPKSTLVLTCVSLVSTGVATWLWLQRPDEGPIDPQARVQPSGSDCAAVLQEAVDAPVSGFRHSSTAKSVEEVRETNPVQSVRHLPSVEGQMMKNSEFRAALHARQRVDFEANFRDLPKMLGLTSDQAERLFDLLAEQQVRTFETRWEKLEPGQTFDDLLRQARKRDSAELAEVLGPSNMIRYEEFRSTLASRNEVNSVRGELALGPEPMREDQFDRMMAIVTPELQRLRQELRDLPEPKFLGADPVSDAKRVEVTVAANQRILDAARSVLSSTQLAGLEQLYRRQRQQMETEGTMNRLRAAAMLESMPDAFPR